MRPNEGTVRKGDWGMMYGRMKGRYPTGEQLKELAELFFFDILRSE